MKMISRNKSTLTALGLGLNLLVLRYLSIVGI